MSAAFAAGALALGPAAAAQAEPQHTSYASMTFAANGSDEPLFFAMTPICKDPGSDAQPFYREQVAKRCEEYMGRATVSMQLFTDSERPLERMMGLMKQMSPKIDPNNRKLRVSVFRIDPAVEDAIGVAAQSKGLGNTCVLIDDPASTDKPLASTVIQQTYPIKTMGKIVGVLTNREACLSGHQGDARAAGISNSSGGFDVYDLNRTGAGSYAYSDVVLANIASHEGMHATYGLAHIGDEMPAPMVEQYTDIIPEVLLPNGTLDLATYIANSEYRAYDSTHRFLMGAAIDTYPATVIPDAQRAQMDWYKPVLSGKPLPYAKDLPNGSVALALGKHSDDVVRVPLADTIESTTSRGQVGAPHTQQWQTLSIESDKQNQVTLYVQSANGTLALLGKVNLADRPDGLTILAKNDQIVRVLPKSSRLAEVVVH